MTRDDALSLFMMGEWIPASVYDSNSAALVPNHLIKLPVLSHCADVHNFPLWSASESRSCS